MRPGGKYTGFLFCHSESQLTSNEPNFKTAQLIFVLCVYVFLTEQLLPPYCVIHVIEIKYLRNIEKYKVERDY